MKLAAIDIGSNSIKLIIVDAISNDSFAVLVREKESVRLGSETLHNHYLSEDAIKRASDTIQRFRLLAESHNVEKIYAVATASVRSADNAAEFIKIIERETGVHIEVLSGIEEARLIGIAAAHGCASQSESILNIDIGGGSTELSVMRGGLPVELFSLKLGAVGLNEEFIANDPPKGKEISALQKEISMALERPGRELSEVKWEQTTGTSGTILALGYTLASLNNSISNNAEKGGQTITLNDLEAFNKRLTSLNLERRLELPGVSQQRAEIIIVGAQILMGVMKALKIKKLTTCAFALREGVVIDRLNKLKVAAQAPPDLKDPRLLGVLALCKRFHYEQEHALQTARLSEIIFDTLAEKYNLKRSQRILLSAAALLHDVGYHISHDDHHKHSLYLIKNSELIGFSEEERDIIKNVARYHRGALPKEKHIEFSLLSQNAQAIIWKLGAILRLADALDRSYDSRVEDLRFRLKKDEIAIELQSDKSCEREIQGAEQKGEMFEIAFNCQLKVSENVKDLTQYA